MKKHIFLPLLLSVLLTAGCAAPAASSAASEGNSTSSSNVSSSSAFSPEAADSFESTAEVTGSPLTSIPEDLFTERDLNDSWQESDCTILRFSGSSAEISGKGASCAGGVVTISMAGDYLISGEFSGQIIVDADKEDKIRLILNGVSVSCENSAPLYVKQADKVVITLAEGSENTLTDGVEYVYDDTEKQEPSAALFSKDDLSLNGSGRLIVNAKCNNAIQGKDDVRISGGVYEITAADKAIVGRDSLAISGGTYTLNTQGDAVKATNDEDLSLGYMVISGGDFTVNAQQDAFSAETLLGITGGTFDIVTAGGAVNNSSKDTNGGGMWGNLTEQPQEDTISTKGLKAGNLLLLQDGVYTMDVFDDAIHSNGDVTISGGTYQIAAGDDGVHADDTLLFEGGEMTVTECYEGLEGITMILSGGKADIAASDDGINAADGTINAGQTINPFKNNQNFGRFGNRENVEDGTNTENTETENFETPEKPVNAENPIPSENTEVPGHFGGTGGFGYDSACSITITGGSWMIRADGDGIDSNGDFTMTGGNVTAFGSERGADSAVDCGGTFTLDGGTLSAIGMSGMASAPSDISAQRSVVMTFPAASDTRTITLETENGTVLLSSSFCKSGNHVIFSCAELQPGNRYVLRSDDLDAISFTLSEDAVTYLDENGVTTGGNGMMGGFDGGIKGGGRGDKAFGNKGNRENRPSAPDGTQLPEGMTPPDGFQMPEGMTPPDGSATPQGGRMPGGMPDQNFSGNNL